ncbi:hypothetical protein H257_14373 [Aphanomyces astaci]|uniref:E3 ubiquitin protein ligase n=2 Tax=Aphanomyces astaci TaxID=112090 RepID=W4FRA4_APHAT|nr:hypothetical protein H257_14373 [Aphanomyces astaci]ETV70012.1 hypothetical protein H257_14373 [Aphanomyces astaci]|eukprot:XP_009840455.1 hypothetical protein H257_14373 [Aphanomyces astaci]
MDERKRGIGESSGVQPSGESKRIRRDEGNTSSHDAAGDSDPHHVKDDDDDDDAASTDKQLRERNMALRDALLEKNRRIQFLETKCGDLFVHRHAIDARLQAVLNQWTILLKTLHTLLPNASSKDIVNDIKTSLGFIAPPTSSTSLPPGIQCEIDAWFLTGTEPAAPPSSPDNDAIHGALTSELDLVTSWVHTLLDNTIAPDDLTKAAIDAKLAAERQVLAYQDKLQTYKLQVHELKSDLNKKELERHSACRRLDRAATHNKMTISSSKKALDNESKEPTTAADVEGNDASKWKQKADQADQFAKEVADKLDKALTDTRKAKASEYAIKQSMDALEKQHAETLDHLQEELASVKGEYQKLKYKAKDIAAHMSDKWGKKLVKLSADNAKLKTKLDDAALKNAELRQRVTTYAAYKDQVSEMKSLVSSLETELTGTKERLDMANAKQQQRKLETTDAQELVEAHESEINALVAEVEAVAKETDGLRAQLAKSMAKMTAKDATISKLHAAVAKAEQANALSFDELAGVRLQVAALTTLQRNQKTLEASLQEALKLKEDELTSVRDHVKAVETLKTDADKDKIKFAREVALAKQTLQMQKQVEQSVEPTKPCEQCQVHHRQEKLRQDKLREARASLANNGDGGGEVSELERYELVELRKKVKCSVCQDAPKEVMISKCSHMFCKECMESNLKARNRKCPTCKKMFGQDDVKGVYWT